MSLGLLEILDRLEACVAGVLNHLLGLPVGCEDCAVSNTDSWHLESEEVHVWLNCCLSHGVVTGVEDATVFKEAARESSEDYDFFLGDLDDASTLSLGELNLWDVDDNP